MSASHIDEHEKALARRFGPAFEKPCARPSIIECALWECQMFNECKMLRFARHASTEER